MLKQNKTRRGLAALITAAIVGYVGTATSYAEQSTTASVNPAVSSIDEGLDDEVFPDVSVRFNAETKEVTCIDLNTDALLTGCGTFDKQDKGVLYKAPANFKSVAVTAVYTTEGTSEPVFIELEYGRVAQRKLKTLFDTTTGDTLKNAKLTNVLVSAELV